MESEPKIPHEYRLRMLRSGGNPAMLRSVRALSWLLPLAALLGVFFWALNYTYPLIGHDYLLFLPKLLAGKWHFVRQGFAPFRYSPHFCGGLPVYGNPQDLSYSLPQFLAFFIDPWMAIQVSIILAVVVGYAGWYFFGRDVLNLRGLWSHVLALAISANGSYLLHMVVGHFTFHTLPFLGFFLWIVFDRREEKFWTLWKRAVLFATLSGYALYAGYPLVLILAGMATVLFFPLDLLHAGTGWRERLFHVLLPRLCACTALSFFLGASKLVAVFSFMRFFPRHYPFDTLSSDASVFLFLLRAFFYIPQGSFLFRDAGPPWGAHEYSMFLSPVILMGLLLSPVLLIAERKEMRRQWKKRLFSALYIAFLVWFFAGLTRGTDLPALVLQKLPLFQSLHVSVRFVYLLSLLVTVLGVLSVVRAIQVFQADVWGTSIATLALILTVLALPLAYLPLLQSPELQNVTQYESLRLDLQTSPYLARPVTFVQDGKVDLQHVMDGTTAIHCFEPLFGYHKEQQLTSLVHGPVHQEEGEFFNMNNPSCFEYPEENHCHPGDRIAIADRENLERFIRGQETSWKLSRAQIIADGISLLTLFALPLLAVFLWRAPLIFLRKRLF